MRKALASLTSAYLPGFNWFYLFLFLASFSIFFGIVALDINSDMQPHIRFIQSYAEGRAKLPTNFAYYALVYLLTGFSSSFEVILWVSCLILAAAIVFKIRLTERLAFEYLSDQSNNLPPARILAFFLVAMAFMFCIPNVTVFAGRFYLGQLPPNVWHNSTTIFLTPLSLLLFWYSYLQLREFNHRRNIIIGILVLVNVFVKPSYMFCLAPVYPLFALYRYRLKKEFWFSMLPIGAGVAGVGILFYIIFLSGEAYTATSVKETSVIVKPFAVWSQWLPRPIISVPLAFLTSLALPLTYALFYWNRIKKNLDLQFAYAMLVFGVLIFAMISETGPRQFHGNFLWQNVVNQYIVAAFIGFHMLRQWNQEKGKNKFRLVALLFAVQTLVGLVYIAKIFLLKSYL